MALTPCKTDVDSTKRELAHHGSTPFPIGFYHDDLKRQAVPWHWHEELEAVVIASGKCTLAYGGKQVTLGPGDGFFLNSGVLHGCWDLDDSGCRFHSMVFHPRLVGGSLDSVFYQRYVLPILEHRELEGLVFRPEISWHREAIQAIDRAWYLGVEESAGYEFQVRTQLSQLLFLLWANRSPSARPANPKSFRDGQRIKEMLQFIHDHFGEELTTAAIAQSGNLSPSECLRCFHAAIATTPIQYLRQYRLAQATRLLRDTDRRIGDIAGECGFSDASYFTKVFRSFTGQTPQQYRSAPQQPPESPA